MVTFHRVNGENEEKGGGGALWAGGGRVGVMAALEGGRSGSMPPARIVSKRLPALGKREEIQKNNESIHLIAAK